MPSTIKMKKIIEGCNKEKIYRNGTDKIITYEIS